MSAALFTVSRPAAWWRRIQYHPEMSVLLLALGVRLGLLALIWISTARLSDPLDSRAFQGGDSDEFIPLAENLVEHQAFSRSTSAPYEPDTRRTPGYPVLLAGLYVLAGNQHAPVLIIAVQVVMGMVNVWLVIKIGQFISPAAGWVAGLIYALAPATLIFTALVMTETLFTLLVLASLWLAWDMRDWRRAAAVGGCVALAAYTRPIGMLLIPVPVLAVIVQHGWTRRALRLSLAALVIFVLAITPWYVRNYAHFDTFVFTSLANRNLLFYNVASTEAHRLGVSWDDGKGLMWAEFNRRLDEQGLAEPTLVEESQLAGEIAFERIRAHPLESAFFQAVDSINLLRPGYSMVTLVLHDDDSGFGSKVQDGNFDVIWNAPLVEQVLFGLMTLYYAALFLLALLGIGVVLLQRQWLALILLGISMLVLLVSPGAAGNARFRVPFEGHLALLAALSLLLIVKWLKRQFATAPAEELYEELC